MTKTKTTMTMTMMKTTTMIGELSLSQLDKQATD
jgi:hypothetical protein